MGPLVAILIILEKILAAEPADYRHLGCYADNVVFRDMDGSAFSQSVLKLSVCADNCVKSGYSYVGLQGGNQCFCGTNYGKHGSISAYKCNFTCGGDACGGALRSSVYYTPKMDSVSRAARKFWVKATAKDFVSARKDCVTSGGDVAVVTSTVIRDQLVSLAGTSSGSSGNASTDQYFIGLWRRQILTGNQLEWVNPISGLLDVAAFASYWASGYPSSLDCVALNVLTGKWLSVSCMSPLPYFCNHPDPPPPTLPPPTTQAPLPANEESVDGITSNQKLIFSVVVPIFAICYGGSCLFYTVAKIYRALKRKRQRKKYGQDEFEHDTQPMVPSDEPMNQPPLMPVAPPPMMMSMEDEKPPSYAENRTLNVESPINATFQPVRPRTSDRSGTPMTSPPPLPPDDPGAPDDVPEFDEIASPPPLPPKHSTGSPKNSEGSTSSSSMSMLLPRDQPATNDEAVIDFTKLSINDILQIKELMGQTRRPRPARIINA